MSINQIVSCCGIGELEGLDDDPKINVVEVYEDCKDVEGSFDRGFNMYVFTDNLAYKNGRRLAAYIRRVKLGKITASPITTNLKHYSKVRLWTWVVNRKNLEAWGKKNKSLICQSVWDCKCDMCN